MTDKADCLKPPISLLVKLGSISVHVEEMLSATGHAFDLDTLKYLLQDKEIINWINEMNKLALLPVTRNLKK